jgi:hypothetical protein
LQGRCGELSSESRTKGLDIDAEEHLRNLVKAITKREKSLNYREHDPNRSENGGRTLEKCENSLVISWIGMGVARVLRMNASVPMVGWKDEHPQLVGWRQPIIDK